MAKQTIEFILSATKPPCRVATTANITLSGLQTIDGATVIAGDRVLVRAQTLGAENGIYIVASGAWTRALDFATSAQVKGGCLISVSEGTLYGNSVFQLTTNDPIELDVTELVFALPALPSYYLVDAGAADAISVTVPAVPPLTSWDQLIGIDLTIKIIAANTGAATFAVVGLSGTKTIKKRVDSNLSANDLLQNGIYEFVFDGVDLQLKVGLKGDQGQTGAAGGVVNELSYAGKYFCGTQITETSSPFYAAADIQTCIDDAYTNGAMVYLTSNIALGNNSLIMKNGVNIDGSLGVTVSSDAIAGTLIDNGVSCVCKVNSQNIILTNSNGQYYCIQQTATTMTSNFNYEITLDLFLTQSNTSVPVSVPNNRLKNTLNWTSTFTYVGVGDYRMAIPFGLSYYIVEATIHHRQPGGKGQTMPIPYSAMRLLSLEYYGAQSMAIGTKDMAGTPVNTTLGIEIHILAIL